MIVPFTLCGAVNTSPSGRFPHSPFLRRVPWLGIHLQFRLSSMRSEVPSAEETLRVFAFFTTS